MSERERLLKIRREFLLEKHKEAEAIFSKDKFKDADIDRLVRVYVIASQYSEDFFRELVEQKLLTVEEMKKDLAGIMNKNKQAKGLFPPDFAERLGKRVGEVVKNNKVDPERLAVVKDFLRSIKKKD